MRGFLFLRLTRIKVQMQKRLTSFRTILFVPSRWLFNGMVKLIRTVQSRLRYDVWFLEKTDIMGVHFIIMSWHAEVYRWPGMSITFDQWMLNPVLYFDFRSPIKHSREFSILVMMKYNCVHDDIFLRFMWVLSFNVAAWVIAAYCLPLKQCLRCSD